jgi:ADP-ribose pyrophosphatase
VTEALAVDPRVEVRERRVAFDGHFRILRYRLRHQQFAGGMGQEQVREVFERGHAVVVLPYDPVRQQIVLVEQFRIGALGLADDPWLLEPVAGIVEPGEASADVARREAAEEAGLELLELIPAGRCFVSPGGTTETFQLFIARIDASDAGGLFGLAAEGEDIRAQVVDLDQALDWLEQGRIVVASTIIALQWLALHRTEVDRRWSGKATAPDDDAVPEPAADDA